MMKTTQIQTIINLKIDLAQRMLVSIQIKVEMKVMKKKIKEMKLQVLIQVNLVLQN